MDTNSLTILKQTIAAAIAEDLKTYKSSMREARCIYSSSQKQITNNKRVKRTKKFGSYFLAAAGTSCELLGVAMADHQPLRLLFCLRSGCFSAGFYGPIYRHSRLFWCWSILCADSGMCVETMRTGTAYRSMTGTHAWKPYLSRPFFAVSYTARRFAQWPLPFCSFLPPTWQHGPPV